MGLPEERVHERMNEQNSTSNQEKPQKFQHLYPTNPMKEEGILFSLFRKSLAIQNGEKTGKLEGKKLTSTASVRSNAW